MTKRKSTEKSDHEDLFDDLSGELAQNAGAVLDQSLDAIDSKTLSELRYRREQALRTPINRPATHTWWTYAGASAALAASAFMVVININPGSGPDLLAEHSQHSDQQVFSEQFFAEHWELAMSDDMGLIQDLDFIEWVDLESHEI